MNIACQPVVSSLACIVVVLYWSSVWIPRFCLEVMMHSVELTDLDGSITDQAVRVILARPAILTQSCQLVTLCVLHVVSRRLVRGSRHAPF